MEDAPSSWRVSDHEDGRRATVRRVSDHADGRRATGWRVSDQTARLAFVPTSDKTRLGVWRSEQAVRTCSPILWWCGWVDLGKVVLADVRLGGSAAAGGGDLIGSVSRRAAGARSSLFLLSCVAGQWQGTSDMISILLGQ
jgi:hypothetical protein